MEDLIGLKRAVRHVSLPKFCFCRELLLDVCGTLEENIYQVQLLDMGIPVSEKLVQQGVGAELATPIPVSTKTKQVFSPESKEDIIARLFQPKASDKVSKYGYENVIL